jgi:undecaprenyl-diphosphatase
MPAKETSVDFLYALILGVIEGITEFLPISSTGHLLLASALLNFPSEKVRLTFDIFIQIGAVLAAVVYYGRDLIRQARQLPSDRNTQRFWLNVFIAFLPAAVIGLLAERQIDENLSKPLVIGIALIVGGIVFLFVERQDRTGTIHSLEQISPIHALTIGIAQVFSLIPGVSRSGASIVGGLLSGLDRVAATSFSFYLFIPTLGAATLYKLYTAFRDQEIVAADLPLFTVGAGAAFVIAYLSIVWLLRYVSNHDFRAFGLYRIVVGVIIVVLALWTSVLGR